MPGSGGMPPAPPGYVPPGLPDVAAGSTNIFRGRLVIVFGPSGAVTGVFVYAAGTTPAAGNPPIFWATSSAADPFGNVLPSTVGVAGTGTFDAGNTIINPSGIFFYSATPANGNLIGSITPAGGTDSFGNSYLAGVCSYTTGGAAQIFQGFIELAPSIAAVNNNFAASADGRTAGWLILDSGLTSNVDSDTVIKLESQLASVTGARYILLFADTTTVSGVITGPTPGSSPVIPETWHSLGNYPSGTTTRGRYRLTAEGELEVDISLTGTPASGANSFPNTMPAAYRPAVTKRLIIVQGGTLGICTINTTGIVGLSIGAGGSATADVSGRVELSLWTYREGFAVTVNVPNPGVYQQQIGQHITAFRDDLQRLLNDAAYLNSVGGAAFLTAPPFNLSAADANLIVSTVGAVTPANATVQSIQAFLASTEPLWGGS